MSERGGRERFRSIRPKRRASGPLGDDRDDPPQQRDTALQPDAPQADPLDPNVRRMLALEEVSDRRRERTRRRQIDNLVWRIGAVSFTLVALTFVYSMVIVLTAHDFNRVAAVVAGTTLTLMVGICRRIVKSATPEADDGKPTLVRALLSAFRGDDL